MNPLEEIPFLFRVQNALTAYPRYLYKSVWPSALAVIYPLVPGGISWRETAVGALVLVSISLLALKKAERYPYLAVGWLWFLGTLVPVIGLVQVGSQSMADRYMYLPMTGLLIALAWSGHTAVSRRRKWRPFLQVGLAVALVALAAISRMQVGYWRDTVTLFRRAAGAVPRNYLANHFLGTEYLRLRKLDEAKAEFTRALTTKPSYANSLKLLAMVLDKEGRLSQAEIHYRQFLTMEPEDVEARINLGSNLLRQGRMKEAGMVMREALRRDPSHSDANDKLGIILAREGKIEDALTHFLLSLASNPANAEAHNNLGAALTILGRNKEAEGHFQEALKIDPRNAKAQNNLGKIMVEGGRFAEAATRFMEALKIRPGWEEARANLARIFHTPSTTAAQSRLSADFSSVGLLDVVSTTPARPSVGKVTIQAPLDRLATNQCEICGLEKATRKSLIDQPNRPAMGQGFREKASPDSRHSGVTENLSTGADTFNVESEKE